VRNSENALDELKVDVLDEGGRRAIHLANQLSTQLIISTRARGGSKSESNADAIPPKLPNPVFWKDEMKDDFRNFETPYY
jgi:hypothetical protein